MEMSSGSLDGGDQPELNSRGFYAAVLPETAFQTDSSGKVGESLLEPFHELEVNFGAAAGKSIAFHCPTPTLSSADGRAIRGTLNLSFFISWVLSVVFLAVLAFGLDRAMASSH